MDPFAGGLVHMANYMGNVLLPIVAGLIVAMGIFQYSTRRDGNRYIIGALACLLVSGFLRQAEAFFGPASGSAMFTTGILGMVNWVANVIMPFYAVFCFVRGVLAMGGFMERYFIGDDASRFFLAGFGCLAVSGIVRLLEWFVVSAV